MLETKSETFPQPNGATVEVGTIVHNGHAFAAMGAIIDKARGVICGYVKANGTPDKWSNPTATLTTWAGNRVADLHLTGKWDAFVPGAHFPVQMFAWHATIDGKSYSGRNTGAGMFLRLKARKDRD